MPNSIKQVIKREYLKCVKNPAYFMKKYCVIQHPLKGKIKFNLYDFQEKTLDEFSKNSYNIILKARQLGISTLTAAYSLHMMLFHSDKNILVIATSKDTAKNLVTKVRVMYQGLPSWLKTKVTEDNKLSLIFSNGSQIKAIAATESAGRSEALSLLILDEAAFIDKIDEIWTAAQQTLATGGDCIVLSTPNGVGNWFHKIWVDSIDGVSDFNFIKLHWSLHPDRDQRWRDEQNVKLGPTQAAQECDTDFLSSGQSDIVVADVARGDGSDYSATQVFDVKSLQQVAEYKGQLSTTDYGNFLIELATKYNDALLIVENNNVGWATIQIIIDRGYKNLFYQSKDLKYIDVEHQLVSNRYRSQDKSMVAGFGTTMKTRPLIIAKMEEYTREKLVNIKSIRLIEELLVFIYNNNKPEAMKGYNDDLVMAYSIALWIRDTALRLKTESNDLQKATINSFININKGYEESSFYFGGVGKPAKNPYEIDINGQKEDLTWLL